MAHQRGFNPRARRGRDLREVGVDVPRLVVSIHAPAGGATAYYFGGRVECFVSIHAPAGGATFR